jgi:hypothetical protein
LKLSILLAQYFYQHKLLNLPGIGSFHLDAAVTVPDVSDKNFREFAKYIQFSQQPVAKPDVALIDFIRSHTGKIKPLAESDLESYLADGKLLLNIGKPFHLEGIGTLYKNKLGIYEFTAGEPITERIDLVGELRENSKPMAEKKSAFNEGYSHIESHHNQRKRLLVGTLVVIGLAVILWGGYSLYNNREHPPVEQQAAMDTPTTTQPDTSVKAKADSVPPATTAPGVPAGSYKFILESAKKNRATKRHAFLLTLDRKFRLETSDSTTYYITLTLPTTPADTTRLKDSLDLWYYGAGFHKVRVAQ